MRRHYPAYGPSLLLLFLYSLSHPLLGQSLPLPPPPRYPSGARLDLSFVASTSLNSANGDESLYTFKLAFRGQRGAVLKPFEVKVYSNIVLGASYREDSILKNPLRVGENELFSEAMLLLPVTWTIDPYIALNLRTPVTESFHYVGFDKKRVASLWDPVTSQQSIGMAYAAKGDDGSASARFGLALQQIRAANHTTLTDDRKTLEVMEPYKAQSGIEFASDAQGKIDSNIIYTGKLLLFGSFDDLTVWSVRSENELRFTLWKIVAVTMTVKIIHDTAQTLRTQFSSSMTLGLGIGL